MQIIDQSIDVDADIRSVYNQWTQFESFPEFMEGIEEVRQLDDKRLHWVAKIGGKTVEWDADIYDQIPDQRIAWRAIGGKRNDGLVRFEKISDEQTRVHVQMEYEPEGAMETVGGALGAVSVRVKGDLKRFKDFIEGQPATGAWRGEIHEGKVDPEAGQPRSQRTPRRAMPKSGPKL
jgi:uncharacterized membrane protein